MVIGLNLCPFARRVFDAETIRYVVSEATDRNGIRAALVAELQFLAEQSSDEVETTLLIHPNALTDFDDYNDFLGVVDRMIHKSGMDRVFQIASFHPDYEFSNAAADAVENYSNRSPYPMLHILRVESVARAVSNTDAARAIPHRNIELLNKLGKEEVLRMLKE